MKTATYPNRRHNGFTLIELMIVMLLISIVLAVALPRFEGGVFEDPTKKFSRWLMLNVRSLRSQAIQQQKVQTLVVDLNNHKMWVTREATGDEEADDEGSGEEREAAAAEKAQPLPGGMQIVDVQFPNTEAITSGTAQINFYPAGYSDQVLIHLENDDAERFTYMVQPLLPKVKFFEEWIDF